MNSESSGVGGAMDANGIAEQHPELIAVLARLCEKLGSINRTQASKLPYLVDVAAREVLGERITRAHFQAWKHGVVTYEAWHFAKRSDGAGIFEVTDLGSDEEPSGQLRLKGKAAFRLSPDQVAIVDYIADNFGPMQIEQLGRVTKNMNLEEKGWGENGPVREDGEAFHRLSASFQRTIDSVRFEDTSDKKKWRKLGKGRGALRASLGH